VVTIVLGPTFDKYTYLVVGFALGPVGAVREDLRGHDRPGDDRRRLHGPGLLAVRHALQTSPTSSGPAIAVPFPTGDGQVLPGDLHHRRLLRRREGALYARAHHQEADRGNVNPLPLGPRKQLSGRPAPRRPCPRTAGTRAGSSTALPTRRARPEPEDPHDLPAVKFRPDLVQFPLPRAAPRSAPQARRRWPPGGARPSWHCAWCSRPGSARCSRVSMSPASPHVPAHRRVGPLTVAVAVEPQVQFHELGYVVDDLLGEPELGQPLAAPSSPRRPRGGGRRPCRPAAATACAACRCRAGSPRAAAPGSGPRP